MGPSDLIFSRRLSRELLVACIAHGAAVNFREQVSSNYGFPWPSGPGVGFQGHVAAAVLVFSRTSTLFSIVAVACIHSSKQGRRSWFMPALAFTYSLWVDCLVMALVSGEGRYLAAVLILSPLKGEHV